MKIITWAFKFQYPASWHVNKAITSDGSDCFIYPYGVYHFCNVSFMGPKGIVPISVEVHKLEEYTCDNLKDFAKWSYSVEPIVAVGSTVIMIILWLYPTIALRGRWNQPYPQPGQSIHLGLLMTMWDIKSRWLQIVENNTIAIWKM